MRPNDLLITNIQDIDPPDFIAPSRDRRAFLAGLASALSAENSAEDPPDPNDLLPYRHSRSPRANLAAIPQHPIAIGVPVYGPYLGLAV